ncbi:MAG: aldolase/citrate lyase family protein [Clostridiales bacterium]
MISPITAYHFTQPTRRQIVEYSKKIYTYGAVICFDFEDIIMDLSTHSYSENERDILRSAIAETLMELFNQTGSPKTGVRLNNFSSTYFEQDLQTLKHINPKNFLDSVFLPKSETPDEICFAINALHSEGISFREIIPVIETKRGMENINSLLSIKNKEFRKVAFGHCDFNRDNNYFPFSHQNTELYWEWIGQILSVVGHNNKMFINSPYLRLHDIPGFNKMLMRLKAMTPNEIGQITLAEGQTKMCAEFRNLQSAVGNYIPLLPEDKLKKAEKIIFEFENNKIRDKSISVNSEGVLISPHEYAAAIEYMNTYSKKYETAK